MSSKFVKDQVLLLNSGEKGEVVMKNIRKHYKTCKSFEKNVSNVRREYLRCGKRHTKYEEDLKKAFYISTQHHVFEGDASRKLEKFQELPLIDQYDALRSSKKYGFVTGYDLLNAHMADFRLVPDNFDALSLTAEELLECKEEKRKTLISRNRTSILVKNAKDLLDSQIDILKNGSKSSAKEIIACLFVSGRRECELLNGKSKFECIENYPFYVKFTGVLKKKCNNLEDEVAEVTVVIPLLCESSVFLSAYERLRSRQQDDIRVHQSLSNKQVAQRYASQLYNVQKSDFSMLGKVHDLRGLYAKLVDVMFEHTCAFPLVCMFALSHDVIEDSLHYSSITLECYDELKKKNGNLCIEMFESRVDV